MESEYDNKFLCTYKNIDDDDLYRIQFLQAFKLEEWDDIQVRQKIVKLFNIMDKPLHNLLQQIQAKPSILSHMLLFLGNRPEKIDVFQCLFCADVFQETHLCISDIITYGEIKSKHYQYLETVIFH